MSVVNYTSASRSALGSATDTLAYGAAVGSGDLLFVAIRMGTGATLNTVADSLNAGNWTLLGPFDQGAGRQYTAYRENTLVGTPTLTFTFSASGQSPRYEMAEVTGTIGAGSFDTSNHNSNAGSATADGGAATPSTANSCVIGLLSAGADQTFSQNGAWSIVGVEPAAATSRMTMVYQDVTVASSLTPAVSLSASAAWIGQTIVVKKGLIRQRGTGTSVTQAAAGSITLTKPTGVVSGDVLYAFILTGNATNHPSLAGWTEVAFSSNGTAGASTTAMRKVAGGSEPSTYVFTSGGPLSGGALAAYSGVDNTTPEDATATVSTGGTASVVAPTITTVTDNAWWIASFQTTNVATTLSLPTGFTNDVALYGASGDFARVDHKNITPAGATGTATSTQDDTAANSWLTISLALRPSSSTVVVHVRKPLVALAAISRQTLRVRLRTRVAVGRAKGYKTRNPPVRRPLVVFLQSVRRARYKPPTRSRVRRVFGYVTRKPPIRRPIAVMVQSARRARYKAPVRALFTRVRGYKTRNPPVRPLRVLLRAVAWRARYKPPTHSVLGRVHGYKTRVPPIRPPRVLLRALARARYKPPTHSVLGRVHGYITRRPAVRRPVVLSRQSIIRARYKPPTDVLLGRKTNLGLVVRTFGVAAVMRPVRRVLVLSQAVRRARYKPPTRIVVTKVHGYVTGRPPIRPPKVLLRAVAWRARYKPPTRVVLGRVHGYITRRPPVRPPQVVLRAVAWRARYKPPTRSFLARTVRRAIVSAFPRPPRVVLRAVAWRARYKPPTHSILGRVRGYITTRPPVRPPRVMLRAVAWRARYKPPTRAILGRVHGYVTRNPPVRPVRVILRANTRARYKPPTHSFVGRVRGYITRRPPVRPPRVLLRAVAWRARYKPPTRTVLVRVVRVVLQPVTIRQPRLLGFAEYFADLLGVTEYLTDESGASQFTDDLQGTTGYD